MTQAYQAPLLAAHTDPLQRSVGRLGDSIDSYPEEASPTSLGQAAASWPLVLASKGGIEASSQLLSFAGQIGELRKQNGAKMANTDLSSTLSRTRQSASSLARDSNGHAAAALRQRTEQHLAQAEMRKQAAKTMAEAAEEARRKARLHARQQASLEEVNQARVIMLQARQRAAAEADVITTAAARRSQRNKACARLLAAKDQDNTDLWLFSSFTSWKGLVQKRKEPVPGPSPEELADLRARRIAASCRVAATFECVHMKSSLLVGFSFGLWKEWSECQRKTKLAKRTCAAAEEAHQRQALSAAFTGWRRTSRHARRQANQARAALLTKLEAARDLVTLATCWSCWQSSAEASAVEAKQVRDAQQQRESRLEASSFLLQQSSRGQVSILLSSCMACWRTLAHSKDEVAAAQVEQCLRQREVCSRVLSGMMAQRLLIMLLGAFTSWRVAVRLSKEEAVAMKAEAQNDKMMARRNHMSSRLLARLLASSLETTLAGAFSCWRAASQLKVPQREATLPDHSQLAVHNALLRRRTEASGIVVANLIAQQLELLVFTVFASWRSAAKQPADSARDASRTAEVPARVSETLQEAPRRSSPERGHLVSAEDQSRNIEKWKALYEQAKALNAVLSHRTLAGSSIIARQLVERLVAWMWTVLQAWRSASRKAPQEEHAVATKMVPDTIGHVALASRHSAICSRVLARVVAERLEGLVLGAFVSWRAAASWAQQLQAVQVSGKAGATAMAIRARFPLDAGVQEKIHAAKAALDRQAIQKIGALHHESGSSSAASTSSKAAQGGQLTDASRATVMADTQRLELELSKRTKEATRMRKALEQTTALERAAALHVTARAEEFLVRCALAAWWSVAVGPSSHQRPSQEALAAIARSQSLEIEVVAATKREAALRRFFALSLAAQAEVLVAGTFESWRRLAAKRPAAELAAANGSSEVAVHAAAKTTTPRTAVAASDARLSAHSVVAAQRVVASLIARQMEWTLIGAFCAWWDLSRPKEALLTARRHQEAPCQIFDIGDMESPDGVLETSDQPSELRDETSGAATPDGLAGGFSRWDAIPSLDCESEPEL